jgi:hypothetical protein
MKTKRMVLSTFLLGALLPGSASAQPPDDFPISDRLTIGASLGLSKSASLPNPERGADFSAKVDFPGIVGYRVRVETGRVGWLYEPSDPVPGAPGRERIEIRRGTVSLIRTFVKPVQSSRIGTYAGAGYGLYRLSGKARSFGGTRGRDADWTGGGFQALAGVEYVSPDHRRSLSFDAVLYACGASQSNRVPAGLPSGVLAGRLSVGLNRRF